MIGHSNLSRGRYHGADLDENLLTDYHLGHIALEEFLASQFNNHLSTVLKDEVPEDTDVNAKGSVTLILHAWGNGNGNSDFITNNNITNLSTTMNETGVKRVQGTLKSNISTIRNNALNARKYLLNANLDMDSNSDNRYRYVTGESDTMTVIVDEDDDETVLDVDDDFDEEGEFDEDGFEYGEESIVDVDEIEITEVIQNENKRNIMRIQGLVENDHCYTNHHFSDVTFSDIVKGVKYEKSPKSVKNNFQNKNCQDHQAGMKIVKILIEPEPKTINGKNSNLQVNGYNQRAHTTIPCENNFSDSLQSKPSSVNQSNFSEPYESVDKEICFLY